jgi:hypothetical protein
MPDGTTPHAGLCANLLIQATAADADKNVRSDTPQTVAATCDLRPATRVKKHSFYHWLLRLQYSSAWM